MKDITKEDLLLLSEMVRPHQDYLGFRILMRFIFKEPYKESPFTMNNIVKPRVFYRRIKNRKDLSFFNLYLFTIGLDDLPQHINEEGTAATIVQWRLMIGK